MTPEIQKSALVLMCVAGMASAQTFFGEISDTTCDHWSCRACGYPCRHHHTVSLLELPAKEKPVRLSPEKNHPPGDPLAARLDKRMTSICSAEFVNTNTASMEIVPGLTPGK